MRSNGGMTIENSTNEDVARIFEFYALASATQRKRGVVVWPLFDRAMVETEIREHRQWKLLIDGEIACIWATTFSDPEIWEERNEDPAVYVHRIATHPRFKGQALVSRIVQWARDYARQNGKSFIRLDTVGNNTPLIEHYKSCGFTFLGLFALKNTDSLPEHYKKDKVALFEINLNEP